MPIMDFDSLTKQLPDVNMDDEELLIELQEAADAFIENYCDRAFTGGTYTETFAAGASHLFLQNFPVLEVLSVRLDRLREFDEDTILPPNRYVIKRERGIVSGVDGPFLRSQSGRATRPDDFPEMLQVIYTTPPEATPACVKRASVELTLHWYRATKTSAAANYKNLIASRDGESEQEYPWRQSSGYHIPDSVLDLLQRYRVPCL